MLAFLTKKLQWLYCFKVLTQFRLWFNTTMSWEWCTTVVQKQHSLAQTGPITFGLRSPGYCFSQATCSHFWEPVSFSYLFHPLNNPWNLYVISKISISLVSEIHRMLYNLQHLCLYIIFWSSKKLLIISISQMRNPKLWALKGFAQPHRGTKWKSNHWNLVLLIKIQSSFYFITLGKYTVDFWC